MDKREHILHRIEMVEVDFDDAIARGEHTKASQAREEISRLENELRDVDTAERRVELSLNDEELRDIAAALDHRLTALADARPGWRCPAGASVNAVVVRVTDLQGRVDIARKALAKMPGGSDV